jgi:site-specific DNA-methyltransferase (adenine-specific)
MSAGDWYGTPMDLYTTLNKRFDFTLDPCAWPENRLNTPVYFTEKTNGLDQAWIVHGSLGHRVFMNPPYSDPMKWVAKAYRESLRGALVVGLMRHDPSTKWWNRWVHNKAEVIPIPYRLKFINYVTGTSEGSYNFPSCLIIWHGLFEDQLKLYGG